MRRRVLRAVLMSGVLAMLIAGCSGPVATSTPAASTAAAGTAASGPVGPTDAKPTGTASPSPGVTKRPAVTKRPGTRLPAADRLAGLRSSQVPARGTGRLVAVPGTSAAPGTGRIYRVRVEVESGLDIDRAAFAAFVLDTLNHERSWTEDGRRRFARTAGAADIRVVLASPETSAAICAPLRTFGKLSCREGSAAVLTLYRWVKAIPEYSGNHDGYRRYVVNHEVGHVLGHGHVLCPGAGRPAPVMMQQTKGLKGCRPNSWPFP